MHELLTLICTLPDSEKDPALYKQEWRRVGTILLSFHKLLIKTWYLVNSGDPGLSELMPLYIALLPANEKELLEEAKKKIAPAIANNVDPTGLEKTTTDLDCAILNVYVNFYASIEYKTTIEPIMNHPISERQTLQNEKEEIETQRVVVELPVVQVLADTEVGFGKEEMRKLKNLIDACKAYKAHLIVQLEQFEKVLLKEPEKYAGLHEKYFSDPKKSKEKIFLQMHDDILVGKFPFRDNSPEVMMVKQYVWQLDIFYTLIRPDNPQHRALELGLKLDNIRELTQKHPQGALLKFMKDTMFYLAVYVIPENKYMPLPPESKFNFLARFFTPKTKAPEKPSVTKPSVSTPNLK